MLLDQFHGLDAVGSLRHHLHAAHLAEQVLQLLAGQLFVVDDERGEGHVNQKRRQLDCRKAARLGQLQRMNWLGCPILATSLFLSQGWEA